MKQTNTPVGPERIFDDLVPHPKLSNLAMYHNTICIYKGWYHKREGKFPGYIEIIALCKCHAYQTLYVRSDRVKILVFHDD